MIVSQEDSDDIGGGGGHKFQKGMRRRIVVPSPSRDSMAHLPFMCEARSYILASPNRDFPADAGSKPRPLSRITSCTLRLVSVKRMDTSVACEWRSTLVSAS